MSEPMAPLERRLRELLRSGTPAPFDARERVRTRLEQGIPEMLGPARSGEDVGAPGGGLGRSLAQRAGIVTAFVLGGITGATLMAKLASKPAPQVVYVDRAATSPEPVSPVEPRYVSPERAMVVEPSARVRPPAPSSLAAPSLSTSRTSRLTEERRLLDEARAGLVQGDVHRALERLDQHLARYADGLLREERDAMKVQALVRFGHYDEARSLAATFRARTPDSLFLPAVESAVSSIP